MKKHFNKEPVITKEDNEEIKNSNKFRICDNDYIDTDVKVRDHCHITGKWRGSAHRICNINLKLNHSIPIVFQNLKKYDSHFTMQELGKFHLKISVIPIGLEKYSWVKDLDKDNFNHLSQEFDNDVLDLFQQKGFYPYEYMSGFEKFKEELPSKEKMYSFLTDRKITDKEYENVINGWKKIEMKTMKDYHAFYLKCEVLLLADMFEKFRNDSLKNYGWCSSYYFSVPSLSWSAKLKMAKIKLELIPDPDMHIFFEKGTRGEISYISNIYSKPNNI